MAIPAVIGAAVWGGVYLAGRGEEGGPKASPSPPVSTPTASPTPGEAVAEAAFPGTAKSDTGTFQVVPLAQKDEKCVTHTFDGRSAYVSDCKDWGDRAPILFFFYVTLENRTSESLAWKRSGFTVLSGSDTHHPVDVRDQAAEPTVFLPKSGKIGADGSISGYLVFEVRGQFEPSSLEYDQAGIRLTILFEGEPGEVGRA